MRILTRYVLAELAKVFLLSLTTLTLLIMIGGVVREAANQNLPLAQVVELLPYILPGALRIAVPVTLLLAISSVYGRLSGSNEVVAAKAQGIHPWSLLWPAFAAATLLSLATVWLNDIAVSWGRHQSQRVVIEAVEEIIYSMLKARKSYSSPHFSINVKDVQGRRLILPTLTVNARGDTPAMTITAAEAELRSDMDNEVLKVILRNGTIDVAGRASYHFPGVEEREIPLRDASRAKNVDTLPSWLSLRVIPEQKVEQKQLIAEVERDMAAQAAYQMLRGDFQSLGGDEWKDRQHQLMLTKARLYRLQTEPHRRWSAGFSCLCFAWVGAPMAIRLRNRDFLTSFFICFLPILIVYYPLLAYGVDGAKGGTVPPYFVWMGNVLLLAWGTWLMRKVFRY